MRRKASPRSPRSASRAGPAGEGDAVTRARVRIGGASGFWGDSQVALPQLLRDGRLDFIVFDYLAELTMSLLAAARAKQPEMGYAGDFVEQLRAHLGEVLRQGVKLVSNAG